MNSWLRSIKNQNDAIVTTTKAARIRAAFFILLPNVPRQVSLAGGAGRSDEAGAKALGLLFSQQALCLSAESRLPWLESPHGQRLAGRARSTYFSGIEKVSFRVLIINGRASCLI
jgi:hypothetical protein